jgi:hypothetical protein
MWKMEPRFAVHLGGNTYINTPNLVVCKGTAVLHVRRNEPDGTLGIRLHVYDKTGKRVAFIADGAVVHGDKESYDISTGEGAYAVTERGTGRVIARVQRRGARGSELDVHVYMYMPDGFLLDAGPHRSNIGGALLTGHVFEDCGAGITIE